MIRLLTLLFVGLAAIVGVLWLLFLGGVIYIVPETQYAVKTRLGEVVGVIREHRWRVGYQLPALHKVYRYPSKIQSYDANSEPIVTQDKKKIIIDNFFKWKIDSVVLFRNAVGNISTANDRLGSIVHDAVKGVLGNVDMESIIAGKQEKVVREARGLADEKARAIGVEIVDIRFKRVQLPEANEQRVFERMKSERYKEAELARAQGREDSSRIISETDRDVRVIEAEGYRQSQEIRGEAEALSADIYASAFSKDPEFYAFWRTLETYRKTMDTGTTLVISPKSDLYKYLLQP